MNSVEREYHARMELIDKMSSITEELIQLLDTSRDAATEGVANATTPQEQETRTAIVIENEFDASLTRIYMEPEVTLQAIIAKLAKQGRRRKSVCAEADIEFGDHPEITCYLSEKELQACIDLESDST